MRISFIKCHGSGNDFPLVDARAIDLGDADWAMIARLLADREGPVGGDGILLLTEGDGAHDAGFRMFNSDGSEAETCLNGLRCAARLAFEALGQDDVRFRLKASDADSWRVDPIAPGVISVATRAGPASTRTADVGLKIDAVELIEAAVPGLPSDRAFTALAMPNPHLIAFVDSIDDAELSALGTWCEAGPALIPGRANVTFAVAAPEGLFARTFERGVGLTNACGSAMAASAHAACLTGRARWGDRVTVRNRGGFVRVTAEGPAADNWVTVAGNATFLYDAEIELDLAARRAGPPVIHHRREDEARAWDAAVAAAA